MHGKHMKKTLEEGFTLLGITPPEGAIDKLISYYEMLVEQNEVMNLTAITEPIEVAKLHFLDSAAILAHVDLENKTLIDVGTGAGFPAMVLKILVPSLKICLLDSLQKRLDWLAFVAEELDLSDVTILHGRAEDCSHMAEYRDSYDFATARAVASMPILTELCLPYVKVGGKFIAMKTVHEEEGEEKLPSIVKSLSGGEIVSTNYQLPLANLPRRLFFIQKVAETAEKYPRKWAKIKNQRF